MNKGTSFLRSFILFVIFCIPTSVGLLSPEDIYSLDYSCLPDSYCMTPGGITNGVWRESGYVCSKALQTYKCEGTDSKCSGQATYYFTLSECMERKNPQYQGCCSALPVNPCEECTLGDCPAPLTNTGEEEYKLIDYRVCNNKGDCEKDKKYGDCYENRNDIPTPEEVNVNPDSDDITPLGCQSSSYTGTEINNPINMTTLFTDTDGASDIEAIYVWLKTDTATPSTPQYINSTASSSTARTFTTNSWGFMMHKEGSSWVPYIINRDTEWVKASYTNGSFAIKGPSSQNMVFVKINGVTTRGTNTIELNFDLDFNRIEDANKVADGNYNLFTMVNDVFGFTPYDNYPSTVTKIGDYFNPGQIRSYDSWVDSNKNWYIDFSPPGVNIGNIETGNKTNITFSTNINDAVSLYAFVSNVYASTGVNDMYPISEISVVRNPAVGTVSTTSPYTLVNYNEDIHKSNNLLNASLAKIVNIGVSNINLSVGMNIDANREQSLLYVVTAFDQACNFRSSSVSEDIEDWIVTYGGLVYSSGGVFFAAKDLAPEVVWDSIALLGRIPEEYSEITSEMYASDNIIGEKLLKRDSETRSYSISNFTGYRVIDFYKDIKTTFERRELGISNLVERIPTPPGSTLVGNLGGGSIKVMDVQGDLTVGSPATAFNCNGNGIFFVKDNLIINGDITNGNLKGDACIFVVNGNVTINAGKNTGSAITLGYDQINAYILANGNVTITPDPNFDGLYINGGIQSLGDSGILMDRYLGLNYRTTHPAFVVDHNSKYGVLSTTLIGNPIDLVKVEVGFKPF